MNAVGYLAALIVFVWVARCIRDGVRHHDELNRMAREIRERENEP